MTFAALDLLRAQTGEEKGAVWGWECGGGGEGAGGWWGEPLGTPYSPHTLDGWLGAGNHSTYLPFSSYLASHTFS